MKKIVALSLMLLAMFIVGTSVNAQTKLRDHTPITIVDDDSIIATTNYDYVLADFDYNYTVQVDFDSIKGTIDGNLYWQGSNDGVTFVTITTYALDGVSKDVFPFTSTSGAPYYLLRLQYVESTAATVSLRVTLFPRKVMD